MPRHRTGSRRRTKKEVHAINQVRYSAAEKKADLRKHELEWMSAVTPLGVEER